MVPPDPEKAKTTCAVWRSCVRRRGSKSGRRTWLRSRGGDVVVGISLDDEDTGASFSIACPAAMLKGVEADQ
ncbi:hypothetical protein KC350_g34 [Hortaea werneckii]|nr:hypothetical protein KC350_g34 [Hortaea werneckii]